ncbi:unnamed protein product [Phytophthora fragariaefolia]|uniref:Unnamed protein product n=1 Tax=Phytophthora fragariaefolia TaxID=1490495 RepID=A0A9W7D2U7_9STRA|nr:unnamed protein product [Phytophthora fragariaefolia]
MTQVDYLGLHVSKHGVGANPMNLESLTALVFSRTLKGLQSFLGSHNYTTASYQTSPFPRLRFYAFTERDFEACDASQEARKQEKWRRAICAFEALNVKLADTPMRKHFNPQREPIAIDYASDWNIAAVLAQVHDGVCMPVKFTSRTLKPNELNYSMVEKEILAMLRALSDGFTMLAGRRVRVLTRHRTLAWLFWSKGLQGRLSQWTAVLLSCKMEIWRSARGEEEILGTLAASKTPRERVDAAMEEIAPRKRPSRTIVFPIPTVSQGKALHVRSFDGSAKAKREGGAFSAVIWRLSKWEIAQAAAGYAPDLTVNKAEYKGLLLRCSLLEELSVTRLIIC